MAQNAERLKSIEKMTIEQYLEKYDKYIRGLIYKRADADYRDDAYQEVVIAIINYKDKLDSLDTDAARCAYICQIAKRIAKPQKRANKKLKTYGDFVGSDIDDATDPEEWFLEDNTYCPDNQPDLAKRAWAEEIIDTNEQIKKIEKLCCRIGNSLKYTTLKKVHYLINKPMLLKQHQEYKKNNREKVLAQKRKYNREKYNDPEYRAKHLEQKRKYREANREKCREYNRQYRLKQKEKRNEQFGYIK